MKVTLCDRVEEWNQALSLGSPKPSFLQSWEWGLFQEQAGRTVYRFIVSDVDGNFLAAVSCIVLQLPFRRSYFFSPHGPVISVVGQQLFEYQTFFSSPVVSELFLKHHAVFWRYEPRGKQPSVLGRRVHDVEPAVTRIIDLHLSEKALLQQMKQKTRYNIRLAKKKGVTVRWYTPKECSDWAAVAQQWWALVQETSDRHHIHSHPRSYYQSMMQTLGETGVLEVSVAEYDEKTIAMNVSIRYAGMTSYVHGASTRLKKEFMAPYLLQWESIRRAKERGDQWYDFYGIAPAEGTQHPLAGVSRFKEGFGGAVVAFPGTYESAISPLWYRVYAFAKRLRS